VFFKSPRRIRQQTEIKHYSVRRSVSQLHKYDIDTHRAFTACYFVDFKQRFVSHIPSTARSL